MAPIAIRWDTPRLSTSSAIAAEHYRDGIAALVSGGAHAGGLLAAAIRCDDGFVLAHVGLAVSRALGGEQYLAPDMLPGTVERGERQHAEIVGAWLRGDVQRAADLRREHLVEFPGDVLVVWLATLPPDRAAHLPAEPGVDRHELL